MAREYTPIPEFPPKQKHKNSLRKGILYRIEQLGGFLLGLIAFLAAVVAILSYFSVLPPQLAPIEQWIVHNVFRR